MKLREVMTTPVLTFRSSEPASDALARMRDARVRHGIVLAGSEVIGVVSDRDLGGPRGGMVRVGRTVNDLMQEHPRVASPEMTVTTAVFLLREHRIGCLPLVDEEGKLVGIVTRGDLLEALALKRKRERPRILGEEPPRPPPIISPNREKWP